MYYSGTALTLFFFLLTIPEDNAIIWRSDVDASSLDADEAMYSAVFHFFGPDKTRKGECTATLIDSTHALTAAHCFKDPETGEEFKNWGSGNFDVLIGGVTHHVDKVYRNPCFSFESDGPNSADLAIMHLATASEVTPYPLYTGSSEQGSTFTIVGWGDYSPAGSTKPGKCSDTDGGCTFRAGQNTFSEAKDNLLKYTLSNPDGDDSDNIPDNEAIGYTGDSGGPGFITVSGNTYLAGINSGGDCCEYGSVDQMVRLSTAWSKEWITNSIEDGESFTSDCSAVGEAASFMQKLKARPRNHNVKASTVPEEDFSQAFAAISKQDEAPKFTMASIATENKNPVAGWGRRRGQQKTRPFKTFVKKAVTKKAVKSHLKGKKEKHEKGMARAQMWREKWSKSMAPGGPRELQEKSDKKAAALYLKKYRKKRKAFRKKLVQYLKKHPKAEKKFKAKKKETQAAKKARKDKRKKARELFYKNHPKAKEKWESKKKARAQRKKKKKQMKKKA